MCVLSFVRSSFVVRFLRCTVSVIALGLMVLVLFEGPCNVLAWCLSGLSQVSFLPAGAKADTSPTASPIIFSYDNIPSTLLSVPRCPVCLLPSSYKFGAKYIFQSMPRLLTLWFQVCGDLQILHPQSCGVRGGSRFSPSAMISVVLQRRRTLRGPNRRPSRNVRQVLRGRDKSLGNVWCVFSRCSCGCTRFSNYFFPEGWQQLTVHISPAE